jgi:KaiC/GvpD/RAD55 family RecA-like ATPase
LDSSNRISESDSAIKRNVIKKIHAKRIVIDSISAYSLSYPDEASRRRSHFELFRMLREWGCTSLLIAEYDIDEHKSTPLDFQCDSIIWLYNKKKEGVRIRSVEIVKMRGTKHSTKTSAVEISDNGIKVYPNEVVY